MEAHSEPGPLVFRLRQEDDFWEIVVYPTPGEIDGGVQNAQ